MQPGFGKLGQLCPDSQQSLAILLNLLICSILYHQFMTLLNVFATPQWHQWFLLGSEFIAANCCFFSFLSQINQCLMLIPFFLLVEVNVVSATI
jgi:hypothetical protein